MQLCLAMARVRTLSTKASAGSAFPNDNYEAVVGDTVPQGTARVAHNA